MIWRPSLNTDLTHLEDKISKLATKNEVAASQRSIIVELEESKSSSPT